MLPSKIVRQLRVGFRQLLVEVALGHRVATVHEVQERRGRLLGDLHLAPAVEVGRIAGASATGKRRGDARTGRISGQTMGPSFATTTSPAAPSAPASAKSIRAPVSSRTVTVARTGRTG